MKRPIHLVPGESAAGSLMRAFPDERQNIVPFPHTLSEGRCAFECERDRDVRWWISQRHELWRYDDDDDEILEARIDRQASAIDDARDRGAVVWIADDVAGQLFACWVASVLGPDATITVARAPAFPRLRSIGQCSETYLRAATSTRLAPDDIGLASKVWRAYAAPTPHKLVEHALAPRDNRFYDSLAAILHRFPSIADGLTRFERLMLQRMASPQLHRAILVVADTLGLANYDDVPDFIGNTTLTDMLSELVDDGLVHQLVGDNSLRDARVQLTPLGRDVLAGRRNRVVEVGFDRWVGGTHLDSGADRFWWFDGTTLVETEG